MSATCLCLLQTKKPKAAIRSLLAYILFWLRDLAPFQIRTTFAKSELEFIQQIEFVS